MHLFVTCFKLLQNQDKINPQIHIIWTENQKYRVFTNFHCSFLENLFRRKNIKDKYGGTSQATIEIYVNSSTYQGEPLGCNTFTLAN